MLSTSFRNHSRGRSPLPFFLKKSVLDYCLVCDVLNIFEEVLVGWLFFPNNNNVGYVLPTR